MLEVLNIFLKEEYKLSKDEITLEGMLNNPHKLEKVFSCVRQLSEEESKVYESFYNFDKAGAPTIKVKDGYRYYGAKHTSDVLCMDGFIEDLTSNRVWLITSRSEDSLLYGFIKTCRCEALLVTNDVLCLAFMLAQRNYVIHDLLSFSYCINDGKVSVTLIESDGSLSPVVKPSLYHTYAMRLLTAEAVKSQLSFCTDRFSKIKETVALKARSVIQIPGFGVLSCASTDDVQASLHVGERVQYIRLESKGVKCVIYLDGKDCYSVGCHQPELEYMLSRLNQYSTLSYDVEELSKKMNVDPNKVSTFLEALDEEQRTDVFRKIVNNPSEEL